MAFRIAGGVAAFFVLLGSFLPWASVSAFGMSESVNGMDGDADFKIPGLVFLLLALVIGGLFGVWKRVTVLAAGGVSILVLILGVVEFFDIKDGLDQISGFGDSSYGIGIFLILFGALAGIAIAAVGQTQLTGATGAQPAAAWGQQQQPWGQQQQQAAQPWTQQQAPASLPPQQAQYQQQPAQATPAAQPAQAAPAGAAPAGAAPAGWMPDPYGQAKLRYWDGTRWTEHTNNQ